MFSSSSTRWTLAAALTALTAFAIPGARAEVVGVAKVRTGDVLEVQGQAFRLQGIDAPEPGQSCEIAERAYDCGRISSTALMDLTAGVAVRCVPTGQSGPGPAQATCFADGYDLSEGMVYTGWALAYPRESGRYARIEADAREHRRGLWRGRFVAPWEWRAGRRIEAAAPGN